MSATTTPSTTEAAKTPRQRGQGYRAGLHAIASEALSEQHAQVTTVTLRQLQPVRLHGNREIRSLVQAVGPSIIENGWPVWSTGISQTTARRPPSHHPPARPVKHHHRPCRADDSVTRPRDHTDLARKSVTLSLEPA